MIKYIIILYILGKDPIILPNTEFVTEEDCHKAAIHIILTTNNIVDYDSPSYDCKKVER